VVIWEASQVKCEEDLKAKLIHGGRFGTQAVGSSDRAATVLSTRALKLPDRVLLEERVLRY